MSFKLTNPKYLNAKPWGADISPGYYNDHTNAQIEHGVEFDGCNYDNVVDAFYMGHLKFCGCGNPQGEIEFMLQVLRAIATRFTDNIYGQSKRYEEFSNAIEQLFGGNERFEHHYLQWLDSLGLLEHGISVYGSWLSDEGYSVLKMLEENKHHFEDM